MKYLPAILAAVALATEPGGAAPAPKKYDPGASDSEIKIGNIMPYSGAGSAYATYGKTQAAYFRMINDRGGVNGRKINFLTLDGAYSPPKTMEAARRLVEQDRVLLIFGSVGTAPNAAIQTYLNVKKVPQLFVISGARRWNDPARYPWTMGWNPDYRNEGAIYARHILQHTPNAKIGVLYQNDDFGKDYLEGLREGLGTKARMITAALSYEPAAPSVDSQIVQLKGLGADTFVDISTPKFAAQAIRKAYDIGWKPVHYLGNPARSIGSVLVPAGLDKSVGILSAAYLKDPTDPAYADDPATKAWFEFMRRYYPEGSLTDAYNVNGYATAEALVHVLQLAGDNLTRENVMRQATHLQDLQLSMALPGIKINTSPINHAPFAAMQMMRFDGKHWVLFGDIIGR